MSRRLIQAPVGTDALLQRIRRGLGDGRRIHASRGSRQRALLGDHYVTCDGRVVETHVSLEAWARQHRILAPHEAVVD